jgi:hypothetical protein
MTNDCDQTFRVMATVMVLEDLRDSLANGDRDVVQKIRDTRLLLAFGKFDPDRDRAINRISVLIGVWLRGVVGVSSQEVRIAINHALPLFA